MGLNTTHGAWDGAYSSFMEWRKWLASKIGIDLTKMYGYCGDSTSLSWDHVDDDLKYLLFHSDCDGILTPTECKKIAVRLRTLIDTVTEDRTDWRVAKMLKFEAGCLEAYKLNEPIEFQ